jgi:hypothetical protein
MSNVVAVVEQIAPQKFLYTITNPDGVVWKKKSKRGDYRYIVFSKNPGDPSDTWFDGGFRKDELDAQKAVYQWIAWGNLAVYAPIKPLF